MDLVDMLDRKWIKAELQANNKHDAIAELIDLLAASNAIAEPEVALSAVLEREGIRSTGIGNGLALPHGKYPGAVRSVIAIGRCPGGLDFDSVDAAPVDLIILMLSPTDRITQHIQALARISRFLSFDAFRRDLRRATTAEEIFEVVRLKEEQAAAATQ